MRTHLPALNPPKGDTHQPHAGEGEPYAFKPGDDIERPAGTSEPDLQTTLFGRLNTLPWWVISGAFHGLLLLLAALIGATFIRSEQSYTLLSMNPRESRPPHKVTRTAWKSLPPESFAPMDPSMKGGVKGGGLESYMPIDSYREVEVADLEVVPEAPANEKTLGLGGYSELAFEEDLIMGGSGSVAGIPMGRGQQGVFGRPNNPQGRLRRALAEGGGRETETAVGRALEWLARNQEPDGHWDTRKHSANTHKWCDTSITGLALLAFLGAGHTEKVGQYKDNVRRAVKWLIGRQRDDGALAPSSYDRNLGYANAIAGLALAEAGGMARIHETEWAAQKALDYGVFHQQGAMGEKRGYRYLPQQAGDLSNTGWLIMQLKSARVAGLRVPHEAFDGVAWFLDRVESKNFPRRNELDADNGRHRYGYTHADEVTARRTAMGCLSRQFMGVDQAELRSGIEWFTAHGGVPSQGNVDLYYWYYGTICTFQQGGEVWKRWNEGLTGALLPTQREDGSWNPSGDFSSDWGRVGQTALSALCLEVYYRYLPMYR